MSLPSADDLFRPTSPEPAPGATSEQDTDTADALRAVPDAAEEAAKKPSRRVRHDEKMTVYVTSDELLEIEHARLSLRREHGLAVDRGRLVREAVALVLADLEAHGADSDLVRRLTEE